MSAPVGMVAANLSRNTGAELSVLGSAMLEPAALADIVALKLEPEEFGGTRNAETWTAILSLHASGRPVDLITVCDEMRALGFEADPVWLSDALTGTPTAAHAVHYARIVRETHLRRATAALAEALRESAGQAPLEELTAMLEQHAAQITEQTRADKAGTVGIKQAMKAAWDRMDRIWEQDAQGTPRDQTERGYDTGLKDVDDLIRGFRNGQFIVIAARPGVGKTSALLQIADHVASTFERGDRGGDLLKRRFVGIFSLEMSTERLGYRMTSQRSGIPELRIADVELTNAEGLEVCDAMKELAKLPLLINDSASTLSVLRAEARKMVGQGAKILFIDYLQRIQNPLKGSNREREVAGISHALAELAKELKVPIVALAQLGRGMERGAEQRKPGLADLRESGGIEQDIDIAILLHRATHPDAEARDQEECDWIVGKHRSGTTGVRRTRWVGKRTRFESMGKGGAPEPTTHPW